MSSSRDFLTKDALAGVGAAMFLASVCANIYWARRCAKLEKLTKGCEPAGAGGKPKVERRKSAVESVCREMTPMQASDHKPVRVYMDGCFDMFHVGHSNALRQGKACGDVLIVGVHTDAEIAANKGSPPVIPEAERLLAVKACKFVDEVIFGAPYSPTKDFVDILVRDYNVDFIVHGDDPCLLPDGSDAFGYAKSIGKYRNFKRTEGISTTDIVGRILQLQNPGNNILASSAEAAPAAPKTTFLATSRRLTQFSKGKAPKATDKVVYIAGSWDLFSAGHILALEQAKSFGDFLLVGIHDDDTVRKLTAPGFPLMGLNERALNVLGCKYVDEVIIGAPLDISEDMIKTMNISVVVQGTVNSEDASGVEAGLTVPASMGILKTFASPSSITPSDIIQRIMDQRETFSKRYKSKAAKEADYTTKKEFVEEQ